MTSELQMLDQSETAEPFLIEDFLAAEQQKDLLRFTTAGSVDDGKSTLIGRLLYDSRNIYEDQVKAVTQSHGDNAGVIDFALLTDGLRAEREQGITIDVAYRFFSTTKRKFIIADTPGHEQYTRNMVTGASTAELAIVLVDARKGILTQSRRHAFISSLLGIRHVVAAINKMDLVDFSEEVFNQHRRDLLALAERLEIPELLCIPLSALEGDNVVSRSGRTPWYTGPTLLEHLESVPIAEHATQSPFRFPVQRVIRPDQHFRGFAGQIASGTIKVGDEIVSLPSGRKSCVRSITTFDGDLETASAPQSVTVTLADELDTSRGDLLAHPDSPPQASNRFQATLVWLHPDAFDTAKIYLLKHTTQTVKAHVSVSHRIDVENFDEQSSDTLHLNEIGIATVETSRFLLADPYRDNRVTGSFILVDPANNATVGAGMIRRVLGRHEQARSANSDSGVIIFLPSQQTIRRLEDKLLSLDLDVITTRVQRPQAWRSLLESGFIVLVQVPDGQAPAIGRLQPGDTELEITNLLQSPDPAENEYQQLDSLIQQLDRLDVLRVTKEEDANERNL